MIKLIFIRKNLLFFFLFIFFMAAYLALGVQKHHRFETGDDLALYSQALWHYSRFEAPFSSFKEANILTDHFGPILIFFTPLYWLWPDPRMLIAGQQILLVLGVIPIYLFSKRILKKNYYSLIFSFLYLYFIGIQSAVVADFHLATISSTFLAFAIYFLETERWKFYWISIFLALICKEDVPVYIFALGLYAIFFKKKRLKGIIAALISLSYFYSINNFFVPILKGNLPKFGSLGGKSSRFLNLLFASPLLFFKNFFYPPVKVRNIFLTFFSFGFLPFLSPLYWIIAPFTFLRFFSDPARYSLHFHYTASLTPILAFASIKVFKKIKKSLLKNLFLLLALIGTFYTNKPNLDPGFPTPPISFIFKRAFWVLPPRNKDYYEMISKIPKNASVSAQTALLPHVCHRDQVYRFPAHYNEAEYIVLLPTESSYPISPDEYQKIKNELLSSPKHKKIYETYAGILFKNIK